MPALLTVLPLAVTAYVWKPGSLLDWNSLGALIAAFGGTMLLAFIARDLGKGAEDRLYKKWSGRPTELLLMHSGTMDPALRARRHVALASLFPDMPIPTATEETADRDAAYKRFSAITTLVISLCRKNPKDYPLVFEENCNYGFRRNMFGLKPIGLAISAITSIALGLLLFGAFSTHQEVPVISIAFEAVNVSMLLVWIFWVNEAMVRRGADVYACRLFEAIDLRLHAA